MVKRAETSSILYSAWIPCSKLSWKNINRWVPLNPNMDNSNDQLIWSPREISCWSPICYSARIKGLYPWYFFELSGKSCFPTAQQVIFWRRTGILFLVNSVRKLSATREDTRGQKWVKGATCLHECFSSARIPDHWGCVAEDEWRFNAHGTVETYGTTVTPVWSLINMHGFSIQPRKGPKPEKWKTELNVLGKLPIFTPKMSLSSAPPQFSQWKGYFVQTAPVSFVVVPACVPRHVISHGHTTGKVQTPQTSAAGFCERGEKGPLERFEDTSIVDLSMPCKTLEVWAKAKKSQETGPTERWQILK